jgi:hypothetical protein
MTAQWRTVWVQLVDVVCDCCYVGSRVRHDAPGARRGRFFLVGMLHALRGHLFLVDMLLPVVHLAVTSPLLPFAYRCYCPYLLLCLHTPFCCFVLSVFMLPTCESPTTSLKKGGFCIYMETSTSDLRARNSHYGRKFFAVNACLNSQWELRTSTVPEGLPLKIRGTPTFETRGSHRAICCNTMKTTVSVCLIFHCIWTKLPT